jgi:hypothetical protein
MASLRLVPVSGQPIDVVKDQSVVGRDPSITHLHCPPLLLSEVQ